MTRVERETLNIREKLFPIIGETFAKTYFSYYGIFKNNLMFGLYKNGNFYLKLSPEDIEKALSYNIKSLVDVKLLQAKHYYFIPNDILNNIVDYREWIENSLNNIRNNKYQSYYRKKNQIRALPNMNINFERMLRKININTIEDLLLYGEIRAVVDLLRIGMEINELTLFKLYGAINHKLFYTLSPKIKKSLIEEANIAFYEAGLRKRFKYSVNY